MGCIRVDKILDHICEPLRKCLQDDNPYVRKTAAIGVAKLWDLDQERALENGFVTILQELVSDSNPMVIDTGHPVFLLLSIRTFFSLSSNDIRHLTYSLGSIGHLYNRLSLML